MAISQQETDTGRLQDALLHRETLLVVTAGDADDVTLPLVTENIRGDLSTHPALHEDGQLALILNFDQLLRTRCGVGDVQLLRVSIHARVAKSSPNRTRQEKPCD